MNTKISGLVKKTGYDAKISETKNKARHHNHDIYIYIYIYVYIYITTQEFNKLTAYHFAVRLKQTNLATKSDIDDFVERTDFDDKLKNQNKKVTSNKTKHVEG